MSSESICTVLISVLSAVIAAYLTAIASKKQFLRQNDKEDIKRAVELSKTYALEIMPYINSVNCVYESLKGLQKFIKKINVVRKTKKLEFTYSELESLFSKDEMAEIENIIEISNIPQELLGQSRVAIQASLLNDTIFLSSIKSAEEEKQKVLNETFKTQLQLEFMNSKGRLLNALEYFSMNFSTGIADEKIVYQSLHQTFIGTAIQLYFDISLKNNDPKETFFINFIELFNKWNERYCEKLAREEEHKTLANKNLTEKPKNYKG